MEYWTTTSIYYTDSGEVVPKWSPDIHTHKILDCHNNSVLYCIQVARKLLMTESDFERTEERAESAELWVNNVVMVTLVVMGNREIAM